MLEVACSPVAHCIASHVATVQNKRSISRHVHFQDDKHADAAAAVFAFPVDATPDTHKKAVQDEQAAAARPAAAEEASVKTKAGESEPHVVGAVLQSCRKFNTQPAFGSGRQFVSQRMYSPERQIVVTREIAAVAHDGTEMPLEAPHDQLLAANDFNQDLDKAAVKIQAMIRGKQERKRQAGAGKEQHDASAHTPPDTPCTLDAASPSQDSHPSAPAAPSQLIANADSVNTVTDSDRMLGAENAAAMPGANGNIRVFEPYRKSNKQPEFGSGRQFVSQRMYSPERQAMAAGGMPGSAHKGTKEAAPAAEASSDAEVSLQSVTAAVVSGDEDGMAELLEEGSRPAELLEEVMAELLNEGSRLLELLPDQDMEGLAHLLQQRPTSPIGHALHAYIVEKVVAESDDDVHVISNVMVEDNKQEGLVERDVEKGRQQNEKNAKEREQEQEMAREREKALDSLADSILFGLVNSVREALLLELLDQRASELVVRSVYAHVRVVVLMLVLVGTLLFTRVGVG